MPNIFDKPQYNSWYLLLRICRLSFLFVVTKIIEMFDGGSLLLDEWYWLKWSTQISRNKVGNAIPSAKEFGSDSNEKYVKKLYTERQQREHYL